MMKAEKLKKYEGHLIEVSLKNGAYYKGVLQDVDVIDRTLMLDTLKSNIFLTIDSISAIKQKEVINDGS